MLPHVNESASPRRASSSSCWRRRSSSARAYRKRLEPLPQPETARSVAATVVVSILTSSPSNIWRKVRSVVGLSAVFQFVFGVEVAASYGRIGGTFLTSRIMATMSCLSSLRSAFTMYTLLPNLCSSASCRLSARFLLFF